jgi:glycosyltransferase involved in cell wall biosynthesis
VANTIEKVSLKVGFLTSTDPRDRRSWSGIHYEMYQALSREFKEVVPLGPVAISRFIYRCLRLIDIFHRCITGNTFNKSHSILLSKYYAYHFKNKLKSQDIDVIYAPTASTEIAFLDTDLPICYSSDTSFDQIKDYYKSFSGFSSLSVKESRLVERRAINKSKYQIYSSAWAADYIIDQLKSDNVSVIKYGANIEEVPSISEIEKNFKKPFNLLFIGVDWQRKGGDIAFEAFKILVDKGYDTTFTVCGCQPPVTHPKMTVIPFLNKNETQDRNTFNKLLIDCHLFFMPTRADCTPIVFCETAAYGIPVITTATGGVTSLVEDGVNGYTLPFTAMPAEYAEKIGFLLDNPQKMAEMAKASRLKYEEELNWKVWGEKTRDVLVASTKKDL